MNPSYEKYRTLLQKVADINYSSALLQWDQEVYMPPGSGDSRARQLSTLSGIAHELFTSDELGTVLKNLAADPSLNLKEAANIRESLRVYTDQKKYTTDFVIEMSKTISECFNAWQEAKKKSDFSIYQPKLEKLLNLKRKECELLGYKGHPYDALLDQYEPGATVAQLDILFEDVKKQLGPFIKEIFKKEKPDSAFLFRHYDREKQWPYGLELLKKMNFDFNTGRQDISAHPFTTSFSQEDVRVTTRINENDVREMIWGCIHEGGHALYEQGLPITEYGLPSGEAISLGIHESQSRMWENNVGRSLPFWKHNYSEIKKLFPENLGNVSLESFYAGINVVEASLIRTSADELTYHFHVLIRYEIEKLLISGSVQVADLPSLWNQYYKDYLGLIIPDDARGVLQDVHWSHGSFGYFPTYSLGSIYAAQFFRQATLEIDGLENKIEEGNYAPLLDWLRSKIHVHGKMYRADELCKRITGETINFGHFMNYARSKYGQIYQLENLNALT
jgi:carboxypeptidase Taq